MTDSLVPAFLQSTAGEWFTILSLVFGGCCSNVWALEGVLKHHPKSGTFLTFAQFAYVTATNLSSQVEWCKTSGGIPLIRLKERKVPLSRWGVQVVLFLAVSLMNNYAFGLKIPVTVHIIFRSGGLCVSMFVGRIVGKRRYSAGQVLAALLITIGIITATISAPRRPSSSPSTTSPSTHSIAESATEAQGSVSASWLHPEWEYFAGITLLALALFLSAFLGLWQERTYSLYGRQWKEALFYGHALSLPLFIPLYPSLSETYASFTSTPPITLSVPKSTWGSSWSWDLVLPSAILSLALNIITQGICVRGVNKLTTRVNAVTVNLVLTVRKAVSLGISVWYYDTGMTCGLALGGGMVMLGTILYSVAPGPKGLDHAPQPQPPAQGLAQARTKGTANQSEFPQAADSDLDSRAGSSQIHADGAGTLGVGTAIASGSDAGLSQLRSRTTSARVWNLDMRSLDT